MSRTRKDRPDWVKSNDKSEVRVEKHEHFEAGYPVYRTRPVRDANGHVVFEDYTYFGITGYKLYSPETLSWEEVHPSVRYNGSTYNSYSFIPIYADIASKRVVYETVLIGYRPESCTIDERAPRENKMFDNETKLLCYHEVRYTGRKGYSCCSHFPVKAQRKDYHSASRAAERKAVRAIRGAINNGFEPDEDYYEDTFSLRKKNHRGVWC